MGRRGSKRSLCLPAVFALALVAAASAGAATITSWTGGGRRVPDVVTAGGGACPASFVTVTGSGFVSDGGVMGVTIGGVPAAGVVVGSDQYLYARVGAGAKSGPVVVTTKKGAATAKVPAFVVPCQSTGAAAIKPVIAKVSPVKAKAGKKIRLLGGGFVGTKTVTVGGIPATYAIPSDGLMYVIVPAGAKVGQDTIVVTNTMGTAKSFVIKSG